MPASFDSRRLRNQRAMEQRLTADHRELARAAAWVVLRFATGRDADGQPIVPNTRAARTEIRAAIWRDIFKPYYIGAGTDALIEAAPQSPYASLLVEGITQATRIQAERQAALVRRLVRDPEVVAWLTGPRPLAPVRELVRGRVTELTTIRPGEDPLVARALAGGLFTGDRPGRFVQPRGMYEPFHAWVDPNGYRLSDRIWRTSIDVRSRVDALLDYHIGRGTSATDIADLLEPFLTPGALPSRTRTPYGQEGSYSARRLARTEITAAAGRAAVNAAAANPFVNAMQWALSVRHPRIDICDELARGGPNGDGIYPLGQVPTYPAHPQCLCSLRPVPSGSTAETVASLRQDIQAARGRFIGAASGGNAERALALEGILNPGYLTRAMLDGTLEDAVLAAVRGLR